MPAVKWNKSESCSCCNGESNLTNKYTPLCSKLGKLGVSECRKKLGEIVAKNYKCKMHSRLKFLAYLHLICASSILCPEFSLAQQQQQQQQQASSLTEKIPLGESPKEPKDPSSARNCHSRHCTCSWDLDHNVLPAPYSIFHS